MEREAKPESHRWDVLTWSWGYLSHKMIEKLKWWLMNCWELSWTSVIIKKCLRAVTVSDGTSHFRRLYLQKLHQVCTVKLLEKPSHSLGRWINEPSLCNIPRTCSITKVYLHLARALCQTLSQRFLPLQPPLDFLSHGSPVRMGKLYGDDHSPQTQAC